MIGNADDCGDGNDAGEAKNVGESTCGAAFATSTMRDASVTTIDNNKIIPIE